MPEEKEPRDDTLMREMASHWVKSQAVVSAFITSNVIDIHHADDLIQETATAVADKFHTYDPSRPFTPWVLAIARNLLLKYYRTRSRDRLVLSEEALKSYGAAFERVEEEVEGRRQALRSCLQEMKGRSHQLLQMRYEGNLKLKEIGERLEISASAVSVMLFRVRAVLEKCIRSHLAKWGE